jgi:hypothetical protein
MESSVDTGLLIAALVFCLIGIGLFVAANNIHKKFKFLKAAQLQSIGSIKAGPVKIRGKIFATKTLVSPFSKKPCVYYRYRTTSQRFRSTTGSPRASGAAPQEVAGGENAVPFDLDDGTGRVHINPEEADFLGLNKIHYYVSTSNETMSLKERINKLKEMGESDFKKSKIPVHIPTDLISYNDTLAHSRYDYIFGDVYIEPDSEITIVASADRLADNTLRISKKPIMLIAKNDDTLQQNISNTGTLRFIVVGLVMVLLSIVLIIAGI